LRISVSRAAVIVFCAALVIMAGSWQACALNMLFASPAFNDTASSGYVSAAQPDYGFFTKALNLVPGDSTNLKIKNPNTLLGNSNSGTVNSLPLMTPGKSWMNGVISQGVTNDGSFNAGRASYDLFANRYLNSSNIFDKY
jgi:hypothetical protein